MNQAQFKLLFSVFNLIYLGTALSIMMAGGLSNDMKMANIGAGMIALYLSTALVIVYKALGDKK